MSCDSSYYSLLSKILSFLLTFLTSFLLLLLRLRLLLPLLLLLLPLLPFPSFSPFLLVFLRGNLVGSSTCCYVNDLYIARTRAFGNRVARVVLFHQRDTEASSEIHISPP